MRLKSCLAVCWALSLGISNSFAEEETTVAAPPSPSLQSPQDREVGEEEGAEKVAEKVERIPAPQPTRGHRGNRRAKEAEGTQATKHFRENIIIKSKYELNGEPLEVDTE